MNETKLFLIVVYAGALWMFGGAYGAVVWANIKRPFAVCAAPFYLVGILAVIGMIQAPGSNLALVKLSAYYGLVGQLLLMGTFVLYCISTWVRH